MFVESEFWVSGTAPHLVERSTSGIIPSLTCVPSLSKSQIKRDNKQHHSVYKIKISGFADL